MALDDVTPTRPDETDGSCSYKLQRMLKDLASGLGPMVLQCQRWITDAPGGKSGLKTALGSNDAATTAFLGLMVSAWNVNIPSDTSLSTFANPLA